MSKLLYITCDVRANRQSCCLTAGSMFLEEYMKWHPGDEIHMLDLYRDPIQSADPDVLSALMKTARGHHFATLSTAEQVKLDRLRALSEQFAAAEKYVVVTPMWKPGFPSELSEYLDAVLVHGKTYRNTPTGPEGLLNDKGRKCLLIHAPEGFVYGKTELHCVRNISNTMRFLGINQFSSIALNEANEAFDENVRLIKKEIGKVTEAAVSF